MPIGTIGGNVLSHNRAIIESAATTFSHRARGYMPPNSKLFGRDKDVEEIVWILTRNPSSSHPQRARLALLGAGGQGKTALALEVMAQLAMKQCYSAENSVWISCEKATSAELLLDIIRSSLEITKDTGDILNDILSELRATSDPIILLLDNFETPWNAPGARGAVERILLEIAQIPHVALFITMRATVAPCEEIDWEEMRIQPLDPKASRDLYISVDKAAQEDDILPELLEMLGHMALAVKLMALHGKHTGHTVEQLISTYSTSMLGPSRDSDAQNSISISIKLSLESSLVKNELNATVLLDMIAMLPSGTTLDALAERWAPHLKNLNGALRVLLEAALIEIQRQRYTVIPVIRSYILDPSRFPDNIHDSMVKAACSFLLQHRCVTPGEPTFKTDMAAREKEEINLPAILLKTTVPDPDLIQALLIFARHQYLAGSMPRTEVVEHAVKLAAQFEDRKLFGDTSSCYGEILSRLNRYDQSLEQYRLAREAYIAISEPALAARLLVYMANISVSIDPSTNEIPIIEQAQQEFESIAELAPANMVLCLHALGTAYIRHKNYSDAIKPLTQARGMFSELPFEGAQCAEMLAQTYHRLEQDDEAERWAMLALNELKQVGGDNTGPLLVLGVIYISRSQCNQAISALLEGIELARAHDNSKDIADFLLELGRVYMKHGKLDEARTYLKEAFATYQNLEGVSALAKESVNNYEQEKVSCSFYVDKLDDSSRIPTAEEAAALTYTWHKEDIEWREHEDSIELQPDDGEPEIPDSVGLFLLN
ncbi:hypothetical protein C8J56DRAFT_597573 [Mycena floridula]|nr:hypothetical protein C8J56DRAFT_597573 [Mycena floridula]